MGPVTYRLSLPQGWRLHPVFHVALLSPYRENAVHGPNFIEPPPDLISGENEWEIEAIIGHKGNGTRRRYLIKWKGYGDNDNSWEPEKNLGNASEDLEEYKRIHRL